MRFTASRTAAALTLMLGLLAGMTATAPTATAKEDCRPWAKAVAHLKHDLKSKSLTAKQRASKEKQVYNLQRVYEKCVSQPPDPDYLANPVGTPTVMSTAPGEDPHPLSVDASRDANNRCIVRWKDGSYDSPATNWTVRPFTNAPTGGRWTYGESVTVTTPQFDLTDFLASYSPAVTTQAGIEVTGNDSLGAGDPRNLYVVRDLSIFHMGVRYWC
jgi:hypothetical protein